MADISFEIEATKREDMGKGASRRLRRLQDMVPGIVYGAEKDPQTIMVEQRIMRRALQNEAFYSHILTLKVDGKAEKVVLKDLQRHPFKPLIQHMDFQRVSAKKAITMQVPLHFIGEEECPGVKAGGKVSHHFTEVEIRCLPADLPEFIEVDLSACELDAVIHMSDLKTPKGVDILAISHGHENDQPVASIHMPKRVAEEEPTEAAAEGEGEAKEAEAKADENNKKD